MTRCPPKKTREADWKITITLMNNYLIYTTDWRLVWPKRSHILLYSTSTNRLIYAGVDFRFSIQQVSSYSHLSLSILNVITFPCHACNLHCKFSECNKLQFCVFAIMTPCVHSGAHCHRDRHRQIKNNFNRVLFACHTSKTWTQTSKRKSFEQSHSPQGRS